MLASTLAREVCRAGRDEGLAGEIWRRPLATARWGGHAYRTAVPHSTAVRLSQFWILMEDEFGPTYAVSLARDLALDALGGRTAQEALDAGLPPRDVWLALCDAQEVPEARRHGKDKHQRKTG